jgi:hypothetical protein
VRWIVSNKAFAFGAVQMIACSRSGLYQFAARILDDQVICLVGDASRAALKD